MLNQFLRRCGLLIGVAALLASFQACSQDDNPVDTQNQVSTPPALPDASTMTMDLSFFAPAASDASSIENGSPTGTLLSASVGKENWINAAVRVLYVNLVFCAAFEPPVAAFALAIHSVPQRQPDGSWLWTYIFVDEGGAEYSIFLYGTPAGLHNEWRMEVTTNNPAMPLDHFTWFDGEALRDGSSGYWQFYTPLEYVPAGSGGGAGATPGVPSVRIDWMHAGGNVHELSILVNEAGSEAEGDTVVFHTSPNASYIRVTDVSAGAEYDIVWYSDGSGSLQVPDYNGGERACWDTRQYNIECPR